MTDKSLGSKPGSSEEWIDSQSFIDERATCSEVSLLSLFISGDPPAGTGGYYSIRLTKRSIALKLFQAGYIGDPKTLLGKIGLFRQLRKCHKTNYWKGYSFRIIGEEKRGETLYDIQLEDVSGLGPG